MERIQEAIEKAKRERQGVQGVDGKTDDPIQDGQGEHASETVSKDGVVKQKDLLAVSYTHLTLPTSDLV